jgi:hypothetical protein
MDGLRGHAKKKIRIRGGEPSKLRISTLYFVLGRILCRARMRIGF